LLTPLFFLRAQNSRSTPQELHEGISAGRRSVVVRSKINQRPIMKTTLLKTTLASLAVGAAVTFAGPGPQFWQNVSKASNPTAPAPVAKPVASAPAGCGGCRTEPITEFAASLPNGKGTPRWTVVGSKHTCGGCTGEIASIRGKVTDTMDQGSGACAASAMACCK
jgi:hypothetical protein